jgi:hypothetical protein
MMPKMDGTGPENKGPRTGRGLGRCRKSSATATEEALGRGMGMRRQSGGGQGKGRRMQSGIIKPKGSE